MELNFELTRNDYEAFNKYYIVHKTLKKRLKLIILLIIVIPYISQIGIDFDLQIYLRELGRVLIIFPATLAILYFITIKITKRLPDKDGALIGEKKFTFSEKCFIEETKLNRNECKWEGVKAIESNENYIFIFIDKTVAYLFPKRCFKSTEQEEAFFSYISERVERAQNNAKGKE